jgi:hypothetical protein
MSVGGSLIVPQEIDTLFLKKLKILIEDEIAHHERHFILISGAVRPRASTRKLRVT